MHLNCPHLSVALDQYHPPRVALVFHVLIQVAQKVLGFWFGLKFMSFDSAETMIY